MKVAEPYCNTKKIQRWIMHALMGGHMKKQYDLQLITE
jgi:hypothetical protein